MEKTNNMYAGNMPEKKFRAGGISATIWQNSSKNPKGEETTYKTVSIDRNYKDKVSGEWKSTNSFRASDLPKLALVAQKAFEYVTFKEPEDGRSQDMGMVF